MHRIFWTYFLCAASVWAKRVQLSANTRSPDTFPIEGQETEDFRLSHIWSRQHRHVKQVSKRLIGHGIDELVDTANINCLSHKINRVWRQTWAILGPGTYWRIVTKERERTHHLLTLKDNIELRDKSYCTKVSKLTITRIIFICERFFYQTQQMCALWNSDIEKINWISCMLDKSNLEQHPLTIPLPKLSKIQLK